MSSALESGNSWVEWTGEGDPPEGTVEVRFRDGTEWKPRLGAGALDWRHSASDPQGDIVAYRHLQ